MIFIHKQIVIFKNNISFATSPEMYCHHVMNEIITQHLFICLLLRFPSKTCYLIICFNLIWLSRQMKRAKLTDTLEYQFDLTSG